VDSGKNLRKTDEEFTELVGGGISRPEKEVENLFNEEGKTRKKPRGGEEDHKRSPRPAVIKMWSPRNKKTLRRRNSGNKKARVSCDPSKKEEPETKKVKKKGKEKHRAGPRLYWRHIRRVLKTLAKSRSAGAGGKLLKKTGKNGVKKGEKKTRRKTKRTPPKRGERVGGGGRNLICRKNQ